MDEKTRIERKGDKTIMKYKISTISLEKKEKEIILHIDLENEVKNHKINEIFTSNSSELKKYNISDTKLNIQFDAPNKEFRISNNNFSGDNTFFLKNTQYYYNDSFITEVIIKISDDNISIHPRFYTFREEFNEVIEESKDSLEKLSEKLNPKYRELCNNSINHLKIIQKHFPCFLSSRYNKLTKSLDELDLMEAKEILEIIKNSIKSEFTFVFGKEEEKRIEFNEIDEYSGYDEEKPKIDAFQKQQLPVLKNNLKTIVKVLHTKRYVNKIEKTKIIRLERLVNQIEYVHVEPKKSLLNDLKNLLSEFLGVISSIAGPLVALISTTIGIIKTVDKASEIKENLKNEKYQKDTLEHLGTRREVYEEKEINTSRRNNQFVWSQPSKRTFQQNTYYSREQIVDMIANLLKHHGALTKHQIHRALKLSLDQVENAIYQNDRFIKTRYMRGRCHCYRLRKNSGYY